MYMTYGNFFNVKGNKLIWFCSLLYYMLVIVSFSIENHSNHKNIENDYQSIM
jgi:hypothetical protein